MAMWWRWKVWRRAVALSLTAVGALTLTGAALAEGHPGGEAHPPIRFTAVARPISRIRPGKGTSSTAVVYTPANIRSAYDFGSFAAGGGGKAIAVVDAYGDPSLGADLAAFDSQFGLPVTTVNTYTPDGAPTSTNSNWAVETALDVEWAHAQAEGATVDLVVVPDGSLQHLLDGVRYAEGLPNVAAISMSWGAAESQFATYGYLSGYEAAFQAAQAAGITLFASSGDQGAYDGTRPKTLTVDYPAASPEVVGVGGTTLLLQSNGTYGSESAWSGSGGGYSSKFGEPSYQQSAAIPDTRGTRGVPDVAFDANPNTGVYVYAMGQWYGVGGTSVGAPNWSAVAADAAAASGLKLVASTLYSVYTGANYSQDMHDIKSGNNGYYNATPGWDAVTGVGSPSVSQLLTQP